LTTAVLVGSGLALIALQLLGHLHRTAAFLLLALFCVAAAAALLGWFQAAQAAAWIKNRDEERLEEVEADLESQLYEKQLALTREHKAYKAMHDWNHELRRQIVELQHMHGALGDTDDTRALILKVAIQLLGAEKGLLLSREDLDHDGDLDLVVAEGFERDPQHIPIVQRFARQVIAGDETIREDDVDDPEIDNLVAIPIYIRDKFSGVVIACNKPGGFHDHDDEVLLALGDHAGAVLQNAQLHGLLRSSYLTTVAMLADAVQAKDPFLAGHADEVAKLVANVADRFGFSPERREQLLFGSLLHDIGKIGISERILLKPATLSPEERDVIEMHPRIGYRLVERVPALRPIADAILHHHERWDGGGYPSGLGGDTIPLEARIIAVADAFDAMTSERPYRSKLAAEEACAELERCAGTQFDPDVVRAFVNEVRRMPETARALEREESIRGFEFASKYDEPVLGFGSFVLVDNLTLLYSHRHLHEVARAEAERAAQLQRPFALVLVKLTELERINQEHGYAAGDIAIQRIARVIERTAGRCGGTAARFGGNCIALIAPGATKDVADALTEELAGDLDQVASVQLACAVWRSGETGEDLIERAQKRLAVATRVGS
jgi:diguanylate cyclase (GGDEF)-like protein